DVADGEGWGGYAGEIAGVRQGHIVLVPLIAQRGDAAGDDLKNRVGSRRQRLADRLLVDGRIVDAERGDVADSRIQRIRDAHGVTAGITLENIADRKDRRVGARNFSTIGQINSILSPLIGKGIGAGCFYSEPGSGAGAQ